MSPRSPRFGLLGSLQLVRDGQVVPVRAAKHRTLLAVLAVNANRPVPVERIAEELWQDEEPKSPRKTLQGYVWRLRGMLGDGLLTWGNCYELRTGAGQIDAVRFEELLGSGRKALLAGHLQAAVDRLRSALALWRGPVLADVPATPLISAYSHRLEEMRLLATEAAIEADLRRGRHADVIPALRELTAGHPLRETPRAQLMLALFRSGRQTEALAVYAELRALLVGDQGLEPGMDVRRLHQRILESDATLHL
ncbi:AfsR/SARP family transcriptional regulator [Sphaerisporangium fuscum]|uniref:AfsR/SARP family transcriptional regulator n=1 Tax=Sphaerisporangium fuscum TaxID=2835868 RepID=UPI001BDDAE16|nr:AfsR/SARP family transcriptional regulator [Sphaerisporangium fuscum]